MITASEMERFEAAHGVRPGRELRARRAGQIRLGRFYVALMRRLFNDGMPATLRDLVVEMQEWFIAKSPVGEAPDESTIRRRIQAVWQELNGGSEAVRHGAPPWARANPGRSRPPRRQPAIAATNVRIGERRNCRRCFRRFPPPRRGLEESMLLRANLLAQSARRGEVRWVHVLPREL